MPLILGLSKPQTSHMQVGHFFHLLPWGSSCRWGPWALLWDGPPSHLHCHTPESTTAPSPAPARNLTHIWHFILKRTYTGSCLFTKFDLETFKRFSGALLDGFVRERVRGTMWNNIPQPDSNYANCNYMLYCLTAPLPTWPKYYYSTITNP